MPNTINLITKYVPLLDEVYQTASKTSILDVPNELIQETAQAKSVLVPKITMDGLADYDTDNGFTNGAASLTWETHTFTQDRGRSFSIDAMQNEETAGVAFGSVAGNFIREKVVPEVDAYRFSAYAAKAGTTKAEDLTADTVLDAIDAGIAAMDDAEVPESERVLFVSVTVYNLMKQSPAISRRFDVQTENGNVNRKIETFDGMPIVKVPKVRFKTEYVFNDGKTAGQEAGGFTPAAGALDINFMIVHKRAVVQLTKTALPRVFNPETNQTAHAWKFDYRLYHDAWCLENKTDGIYVSTVDPA